MITRHYEDDQYPFTGFTHTRRIARAFLFDEQGRVAIHKISRDDMFCNQVYYETPGGGVEDDESIEEGLCRECEEEVGCAMEVVEELALIEDAYNLIGRKNENHYFVCRKKEWTKRHFESEGDAYIVDTLWVSLEEAIRLYESMPDDKVSLLVKRRELPLLLHLASR